MTANTTNMVLRFAISVTFILSGISKGANIEGTSQLIDQYCGLLCVEGGLGISTYIVAVVICSFEIFIGMLAFNRKIFVVALPIYTLTIMGFTILSCVNLLSPLGGIESCGCFGELIHLNARETFYKNIALLIALVYLICKQRKTITSCCRDVVSHTLKKGKMLAIYAVAAIFPICVSLMLENAINTRQVSLYYISCAFSLIIVLCVSLRENAMLSSQSGDDE